MIAPRRRAYRLVAEAEAFSIPQIMAFAAPNLRAGDTSAVQKRQNSQQPRAGKKISRQRQAPWHLPTRTNSLSVIIKGIKGRF